MRVNLFLITSGLVLILFLSIRAAQDESAESDFSLLRGFHKSIGSLGSFSASDAIKNLKSLRDKSLLNIPFLNDVPVLHQLLNLYFTSHSSEKRNPMVIRSELKKIIELCLDYGIDVDQGLKNNPSVLMKSLLLRELDLSTKISLRTKILLPFLDNERFTNPLVDTFESPLLQLYMIPCEVVPLSKLLLHAETLVRENSKKGVVSIDWITNLLTNASLGPGAKANTKISDLIKYSKSFNETILSKLGAGSRFNGIFLSNIIRSLDEVSLPTHDNIIDELIINHYNRLDSTNVDSQIRAWNYLLSYKDSYHRNIFHNIAMAGASNMLKSLSNALNQTLDQLDDREIILKTLNFSLRGNFDRRNFLPYQYALVRHGVDSNIFYEIVRLYSLLFSSFNADAVSSYLVHDHRNSNSAIGLTCETGGSCAAPKSSLKSSGGWDDSRLNLFEISSIGSNQNYTNNFNELEKCDIEEIWDGFLPSPEFFYEQYIRHSKPVIFRGINGPSSELLSAFSKENFVKKYGSHKVPLSIIPYAGSFGFKSFTSTLGEISEMSVANFSLDGLKVPPYAFTIAHDSWKYKIQEDIPLPSCLAGLEVNGKSLSLNDGTVETQFYLGPRGTGAPVHYHGHAMNSLAYGEKKWYLYPPSRAFYSTVPALEFAIFDDKAQEALTCTQREGDVMFVPSLWGHGTLNMKQSIGVAHEFSIEPFCSE